MSVKNTPDGESPAPQAPEESAWTVDDPAHVASDVVAGPDAAGEPEAVSIVETAAGESPTVQGNGRFGQRQVKFADSGHLPTSASVETGIRCC